MFQKRFMPPMSPQVPGQQFGPGQPQMMPGQQFGMPQQQFGMQQPQFDMPGQQFGMQQPQFDMSGQQFGMQQPQFDMPGQQFGMMEPQMPGQQFGMGQTFTPDLQTGFKPSLAGQFFPNPMVTQMMNQLDPVIQYGIRQARLQGVPDAMKQVSIIAFLMGSGYDYEAALRIAESFMDGDF